MLFRSTDVFGFNKGLNLLAASQSYGIPPNSITPVNQDLYYLNEIDHNDMARIYSAMDVLANPSMGEGFGLPIVEAQACGTPVIVTDWTSMPELVGAGWLVDGEPWRNAAQDSWWKLPAISEILDALEQAYAARGDQELRDKARAFAVQYDADHVTETYWKPALEALDSPREVPPLPFAPNRKQRRAALRAAA